MKLLGMIACAALIVCIATVSNASGRLSDIDAKRLIDEGIREFLVTIPEGTIRFRTALDPDVRPDPKNRSYPWKFLEALQGFAKGGLISLQELPPQGMEIVTKSFQVTLSPQARNAVLKKDEWGRPIIKAGDRVVTRIVRNTDWKHAAAGNDEYRLVLAVYDFAPTSLWAEFEKKVGEISHKSYKVRALLKYDPFKERFSLVAWDIGRLDKDDWSSKNVPD